MAKSKDDTCRDTKGKVTDTEFKSTANAAASEAASEAGWAKAERGPA